MLINVTIVLKYKKVMFTDSENHGRVKADLHMYRPTGLTTRKNAFVKR